MLDMKVEKKTESFYIPGYLLELLIKNMAIWEKKKIEIWQIWVFFSWNFFVKGRNHVF